MARSIRVATTIAVVVGSALVPSVRVPAATKTPRWVLHVRRFPGGLSNTFRAAIDPAVTNAAATQRRVEAAPSAAPTSGNVQMNTDSYPPLPQNETAVAHSTENQLVAVAASNDYVSGGNMVMRTADGGRSWKTTNVVPVFRGPSGSEVCTGGDPTLAYSQRDHVFVMGQLCFFRSMPASEVQLFVSRDNGATWTPGRQSAVAASNFNADTGTIKESIVNDRDTITIDNTPTSPHYGRIYPSDTKVHLL